MGKDENSPWKINNSNITNSLFVSFKNKNKFEILTTLLLIVFLIVLKKILALQTETSLLQITSVSNIDQQK